MLHKCIFVRYEQTKTNNKDDHRLQADWTNISFERIDGFLNIKALNLMKMIKKANLEQFKH